MITDLARFHATGPGGPHDLFPDLSFTTPWQALAWLALGPGERRNQSAVGEAGYLVLSGRVRVEQGGTVVEAAAPAAVRCAVGPPHALIAAGEGAGLVTVEVAVDGTGGALAVDALDRARLPWRPAIHGGDGRIGTRHLWPAGDFASTWTFLDHAVLAPGGSLGHHYHDHLEESFVILAGHGWMTIGGDTGEVSPGAVTFQPATVGHGLCNAGEEALEFVRVAVAAPGQTCTTIDLHDDLRQRRPALQESP